MSATADDEKKLKIAATVEALRKAGKRQLDETELALLNKLASTGDEAKLGSLVRDIEGRVKQFVAAIRDALSASRETLGEDDELAALEMLALDWNVSGQHVAEALIRRREASTPMQSAAPSPLGAASDLTQGGQAKPSPQG